MSTRDEGWIQENVAVVCFCFVLFCFCFVLFCFVCFVLFCLFVCCSDSFSLHLHFCFIFFGFIFFAFSSVCTFHSRHGHPQHAASPSNGATPSRAWSTMQPLSSRGVRWSGQVCCLQKRCVSVCVYACMFLGSGDGQWLVLFLFFYFSCSFGSLFVCVFVCLLFDFLFVFVCALVCLFLFYLSIYSLSIYLFNFFCLFALFEPLFT